MPVCLARTCARAGDASPGASWLISSAFELRVPDMRAFSPSPRPSRYHLPMTIRSLFATRVYHARLPDEVDVQELEVSCRSVAARTTRPDSAGARRTDFPAIRAIPASRTFPWRFPIFERVRNALDLHVAEFAEELAFDLEGRPLVLEDLWINILPEGGIHTSHIHPQSVISGTVYAAMPEGCAALKLEDPRLAMMMAAPPRKKHAAEELQQFVYVQPAVGDVLLWESWLRHEVPMNLANDDRISVQFQLPLGHIVWDSCLTWLTIGLPHLVHCATSATSAPAARNGPHVATCMPK